MSYHDYEEWGDDPEPSWTWMVQTAIACLLVLVIVIAMLTGNWLGRGIA